MTTESKPPFKPGDMIVVKDPPAMHPWPGAGPWVVAWCDSPNADGYAMVYVVGREHARGFNYGMPASKFKRVSA